MVLPRLRALAMASLIAAAYAGSAWLSVRVALVSDVTPLWPPIGIAVVAIVLLGSRAIIPVALGGLLFEGSDGILTALEIVKVAGATLAPAAVAITLRRRDFSPRLGTLRDGALLIGVGAAGALISAGIGTSTLVWGSDISSSAATGTFSVWWTGDTMGIIIVAPFLFAAARFPRLAARIPLTRASAILAVTIVASLATSLTVRSAEPLLFAVVPAVIFAGGLGEIWGASFTALAISSTAILAHPSSAGLGGDSLAEQMARLQGFNATIAVSGLVFAGLATERRRAWEQLRGLSDGLERLAAERASELQHAERRLEEAQAAGDVACWEASLEDGHVWGSGAIGHLLRIPCGDAPIAFGNALALVHPDDQPGVVTDFTEALTSNAPVNREIRIMGVDGSARWFNLRGRALRNAAGGIRFAGTVTDIAIRHQAAEDERQLLASELRRRQALEINDAIVGHLSTARFALRKGDLASGLDIIEKTREAARQMVSDLIHPVRDRGLSLEVGDIVVPNAVLDLRPAPVDGTDNVLQLRAVPPGSASE